MCPAAPPPGHACRVRCALFEFVSSRARGGGVPWTRVQGMRPRWRCALVRCALLRGVPCCTSTGHACPGPVCPVRIRVQQGMRVGSGVPCSNSCPAGHACRVRCALFEFVSSRACVSGPVCPGHEFRACAAVEVCPAAPPQGTRVGSGVPCSNSCPAGHACRVRCALFEFVSSRACVSGPVCPVRIRVQQGMRVGSGVPWTRVQGMRPRWRCALVRCALLRGVPCCTSTRARVSGPVCPVRIRVQQGTRVGSGVPCSNSCPAGHACRVRCALFEFVSSRACVSGPVCPVRIRVQQGMRVGSGVPCSNSCPAGHACRVRCALDTSSGHAPRWRCALLHLHRACVSGPVCPGHEFRACAAVEVCPAAPPQGTRVGSGVPCSNSCPAGHACRVRCALFEFVSSRACVSGPVCPGHEFRACARGGGVPWSGVPY